MNRRNFLNRSILTAAAACISRRGFALETSTTASIKTMHARFCWMKALNGKDTHVLLDDTRMHTIAHKLYNNANMPFWRNSKGHTVSAYRTMIDFIGGPTDPLRVEHHRFVMASGHMGQFALNSGLLWIDTHYLSQNPECRSVFAALDVTSPTQTLYLVPNNESDFQELQSLPHNYKMNLRRWLHNNRSRFAGTITEIQALDISTGSMRKVLPEELNLSRVRFSF